jgi:hypothetical protein
MAFLWGAPRCHPATLQIGSRVYAFVSDGKIIIPKSKTLSRDCYNLDNEWVDSDYEPRQESNQKLGFSSRRHKPDIPFVFSSLPML